MLPIRGGASITRYHLTKIIQGHNSAFIADIAWAYYDLAPIFGVDPAAAMCQAIHETGWFTSPRAVKQNNFAGIGVTSNTAIGAIDVSIIGGVLRHLSHLVAYSVDGRNEWAALIDQRYDLVLSLRPNKAKAVAVFYQDLDGKWANPGRGYGDAIEKIHADIQAAA